MENSFLFHIIEIQLKLAGHYMFVNTFIKYYFYIGFISNTVIKPFLLYPNKYYGFY